MLVIKSAIKAKSGKCVALILSHAFVPQGAQTAPPQRRAFCHWAHVSRSRPSNSSSSIDKLHTSLQQLFIVTAIIRHLISWHLVRLCFLSKLAETFPTITCMRFRQFFEDKTKLFAYNMRLHVRTAHRVLFCIFLWLEWGESTEIDLKVCSLVKVQNNTHAMTAPSGVRRYLINWKSVDCVI